MSNQLTKILLVEDNVVNARLIQTLLSKAQDSPLAEGLSFQLTVCDTLSSAIEKIENHPFDLILLDLMLPDSKGLESLITLKEKNPQIPVIIQTGSEEDTIVVQAFQQGAHGYLRKTNLDSNLLIYAIRLALERQKYVGHLEEIRKQQQQEVEFQSLENLASAIKTSVTARMFAAEALKDSFPEIFHELVQNYSHLLDLSLEERAYKVDYEISEQLRSLADKLGFLKASPRDVVDIHTQALKEKNKNAKLPKIQAYVDEGRLRLLELMGYLTSYYRKYYIGLSNLNILSTYDD